MEMKYKIKNLNNDPEPIGWLAKISVKPLSLVFAWAFANFTLLTPNMVSMMAFILAIVSGYFFLKGVLLWAGILYFFSYMMDYIDGAIARVKHNTSKFGAYLDNYIGRLGFILVSFGLSVGQYLRTDDIIWLIIWPLVYILFTIHDWESNLVSRIIGESFRDIVKGNKGGKKEKGLWSLLVRFRKIAIKHKLIEPFSRSDMLMLTFMFGPIFASFYGHLKEIIIFALLVLTIKFVFWFVYYRRILVSIDRSS